jgi:hypothetical protein
MAEQIIGTAGTTGHSDMGKKLTKQSGFFLKGSRFRTRKFYIRPSKVSQQTKIKPTAV